jgi:hypothetical protein
MKLLIPALLAVMVWFSVPQAVGAAGPYEDVPIGALTAQAVKEAMQKTLSPQGRFVILATNGTVRIFDSPQNIAAARGALETMQNAPAMVSFAIIINTGMHKVTRTASTGDDEGYDFPVPYNYAPPQIVQNGRRVTAIPATPRDFRSRQAGYGGYVYEGGYVTGTEVNTEETGVEGGVPHKFEGSTVYPKPAAVTVCAKAPEPAALHDWAVKNGAVKENEPAWTAARTEILVTPERTEDGMVLNLLPQIVVAGADGSPRLIPLRTCATSVTIKQGAPATFDGFPGADADFYRVFLGAQESKGDALSSITVGAAVEYVTQQTDKK